MTRHLEVVRESCRERLPFGAPLNHRCAPEGAWPEHIHISADLLRAGRGEPYLAVEYDLATRAQRAFFRLPGDDATYDLTPESGKGEEVWIYEGQLRTADSSTATGGS